MFKNSRKFLFAFIWLIFAIVGALFSFIVISILGKDAINVSSVAIVIISFSGIVNLIVLGGESVRDVKISTPMGSIAISQEKTKIDIKEKTNGKK